MTVMEVCKYGKIEIKFGFHRFRPFPNILVFMDLWIYGNCPKSKIVRFVVNFNHIEITSYLWVLLIQNRYLLILFHFLPMNFLFMVFISNERQLLDGLRSIILRDDILDCVLEVIIALSLVKINLLNLFIF